MVIKKHSEDFGLIGELKQFKKEDRTGLGCVFLIWSRFEVCKNACKVLFGVHDSV